MGLSTQSGFGCCTYLPEDGVTHLGFSDDGSCVRRWLIAGSNLPGETGFIPTRFAGSNGFIGVQTEKHGGECDGEGNGQLTHFRIFLIILFSDQITRCGKTACRILMMTTGFDFPFKYRRSGKSVWKSPSVPLCKEGSLAVPALKSRGKFGSACFEVSLSKGRFRGIYQRRLNLPQSLFFKEGSLAVPALKSPLVKGRFRGIYNGA
jgi:hypothetical protein